MLIVGSFSQAVRVGLHLVARRPAPVALAVPLGAFGAASLFMVLARVAWGRVVVPLGAEVPLAALSLLTFRHRPGPRTVAG